MEKKKSTTEYEYCRVCKINQNQGRRHNFYPRHSQSLSSLLSRFLSRLSLLKSSLINPTLLLSHHSSFDTFWCIFCELDLEELGCSFSRENVIKHLASEEHLKNLKHFLWKYGGQMNKLNSFRITEAEFAKWKKRCEVLKREAASPSKICQGPSHGELNDIQPSYEIMNSSDKNSINFAASNLSNDVMPLQYATNENYQVYHSDIQGAGKAVSSDIGLARPMPLGSEYGWKTWVQTPMGHNTQHSLTSNTKKLSVDGFSHAGVHRSQSTFIKEPFLTGYQNLTHISYEKMEDNKGNIHSGAPPPWLDGIGSPIKRGLAIPAKLNGTQKNSKKSKKLNPNRVGAAWAEGRRMELEMEKRGVIAKPSDPDWLPNFGRVWQPGSRKESMKEFKEEKANVPIAERQPEAEIKLQPYISKRMRRDTNGTVSECVQESGDT